MLQRQPRHDLRNGITTRIRRNDCLRARQFVQIGNNISLQLQRFRDALFQSTKLIHNLSSSKPRQWIYLTSTINQASSIARFLSSAKNVLIFPPLCCISLPTVERKRDTSASAAFSWAWSRSMMLTGPPRLDHYNRFVRFSLRVNRFISHHICQPSALRPCAEDRHGSRAYHASHDRRCFCFDAASE
jgi:hypothetical protein